MTSQELLQEFIELGALKGTFSANFRTALTAVCAVRGCV